MNEQDLQTDGTERHLALQDLSRDHHDALVQALRLKKGGFDEDDPVDDRELAREFLDFWYDHSRWHFREEEEVLLPVYSRRKNPLDDDDIRKMLTDHAWFRDRVYELEQKLEKGEDLRAFLEELGDRLQSHARLEERKIFGRMQEHLTDRDLKDIHRRSREFRIRWRGVDACGPGKKTTRGDLFSRLSDDHNRMLAQAKKLQNVSGSSDTTQINEQAREFLEFWQVQMKLHLREEDEVLLPAAGRHMETEENENLSTFVQDHKLLRDAVSSLEESLNENQISSGELSDLAELVIEHVMFEEDDLFPELKEALPEEELDNMQQESDKFRETYRTPEALEDELNTTPADSS